MVQLVIKLLIDDIKREYIWSQSHQTYGYIVMVEYTRSHFLGPKNVTIGYLTVRHVKYRSKVRYQLADAPANILCACNPFLRTWQIKRRNVFIFICLLYNVHVRRSFIIDASNKSSHFVTLIVN